MFGSTVVSVVSLDSLEVRASVGAGGATLRAFPGCV